MNPEHATPTRMGNMLRTHEGSSSRQIRFIVPPSWLPREIFAALAAQHYKEGRIDSAAGRGAQLSTLVPLDIGDKNMFARGRDLIRKVIFHDQAG